MNLTTKFIKMLAATIVLSTSVIRGAEAPYTGPVIVRTITSLHSARTAAGAVWEGSLAADIQQPDGRVVYPKGTLVQGVVEQVIRKQDGPQARMMLKLTAIDKQQVNGSTHQADGVVESRKASRTMTGWGLTGVVVGSILGGKTGAIAGGAAGAGIGAARAATKIRHDSVVPSESLITFQVN